MLVRIFILGFSLLSFSLSLEAQPKEKLDCFLKAGVSPTLFYLQTLGASHKIRMKGPDAFLNYCEEFSERFVVAEINMGTAGTSSMKNITKVFVFRKTPEATPLKLEFEIEIEETVDGKKSYPRKSYSAKEDSEGLRVEIDKKIHLFSY